MRSRNPRGSTEPAIGPFCSGSSSRYRAGHCRHGALYGVWHWNKWFDALIYLRDRDLFPLQLILREILIQNDTSKDDDLGRRGDRMPVGETIKYATIMVATPPILFLYPFLQKYFVKGVMIGAIKE